jgi:ABC-2 type transport system permease protein
VLAERAATLLIDMTPVAAVTGLAMWVFSLAFGMHLGVAAIASAADALGIFGFFTGTVALAVGAATGSAALARGLAALIAVASYLINALA